MKRRTTGGATSAFVPLLYAPLDEILCLKAERTLRRDNCVSYGERY